MVSVQVYRPTMYLLMGSGTDYPVPAWSQDVSARPLRRPTHDPRPPYSLLWLRLDKGLIYMGITTTKTKSQTGKRGNKPQCFRQEKCRLSGSYYEGEGTKLFIYYPPEVRGRKYWGLGVFLLQYFPLVKI